MSHARGDGGVSGAAYGLLLLGSVSYFLYLFVWFSLPAFLSPIIADLGLSNTQAGIVAGAIQLVYIPLSLVSGLVIDRVGSRLAIGGGLLLIGLAHAGRSGATGFATILLLTALLGAGGTAITFGLPKLVSELFPPDRTGAMSSVYLIGSALGTAAAFGIGRPIIGPLVGGWRPFFLSSGLLLIAYAVVWLVGGSVLRRRVDVVGRGDDPTAFSLGSVRADVRAVVSHRGLRLLVVIGTMQLFINHGLQAWLPTVLEVRGMTAGVAATVTSLLVIARIVGTVSIPPLSDRFSARRIALVGCGVLAGAGTVGMLLTGARPWLTVGVVAVLGVGMGGLSPLVRAIPIELDGIGPRLTATATGLIFTVGEIGGFAGPFLIGGLYDLTGSYTPGIGVLVVGSGVLVAAAYVMEEPRRAGPH